MSTSKHKYLAGHRIRIRLNGIIHLGIFHSTTDGGKAKVQFAAPGHMQVTHVVPFEDISPSSVRSS